MLPFKSLCDILIRYGAEVAIGRRVESGDDNERIILVQLLMVTVNCEIVEILINIVRTLTVV